MDKKIIAMWSGPRNISTAMMRAWENRPDTIVWDEPLYGYYLAKTKKQHPGFEKIIEVHGSDESKLISKIIDEDFAQKYGNNDTKIFYQKHMTHHVMDGLNLKFLDKLHHAFLIRSPEQVVHSYAQRIDTLSLEDVGFKQQAKLFDYICDKQGKAPIVVHSDDILKNPVDKLTKLCQSLDVPFIEAMLYWPAGERDSDGVWAEHWYKNVRKTTGFNEYQSNKIHLDDEYLSIAKQAQPYYEKLLPYAI